MIHRYGSFRTAGMASVCLVGILAFPSRSTALTPDQVFQQVSGSVVTVRALNANETPIKTGSGVVIAPQTVITNCHVIAKSKFVQIRQGKVSYEATLEYPDPDRDLCQLKVPDLNAKPVAMAKSMDTLKVGEKVYAIGSPLGLDLTLSEGIISGLRDIFEDSVPLIQTTASISQGSSGGGLFNQNGQLIGITTFFAKYGQNLNFAHPATWVREVPTRAKELLSQEKAKQLSATPQEQKPGAQTAVYLSQDELNALAGRDFPVFGFVGVDKLSLSRSGWFTAPVAGAMTGVSGTWAVSSADGVGCICLSQRTTHVQMRTDVSGCYQVQNRKGKYIFRAPSVEDD